MKNPFKELLQDEKLPMLIKGKVMDDIEVLKLTIDFADLFIIKHPNTLNNIFKTTKKDKKN